MADETFKPDDNIPVVYVNGFNVFPNMTDVQLNLFLEGERKMKILISPITAKNLGKKLIAQIEDFEKNFETKIEDYDELNKKVEVFFEKQKVATNDASSATEAR